MALEAELQYYRLHRIDLLGVNNINEGRYAVIKGNDCQGSFPSYEDALEAGFGRHGLVPFLVKKIEREESIHYISRLI